MATLQPPPIQTNVLNGSQLALEWVRWLQATRAKANTGDAARYILQTAEAGLPNAQALGALATGYLKVTTATGVLTSQLGQALTAANDTNVTLALGGTPTLALLAPASLTLGWTGVLGVARGGLNANLSATGGANQVLKQVSAGAPITVGGLPSIVGRLPGQTAAVPSLATWTVGAVDGDFLVSMNVLVTTSTTHTFTGQCTFTDEGGTARTATMPFRLVGDTTTIRSSITDANGAVPYLGIPLQIRAQAGTVITLLTQAAGTYTTCTFNISGAITQLA